jgi:hypothetical protein
MIEGIGNPVRRAHHQEKRLCMTSRGLAVINDLTISDRP